MSEEKDDSFQLVDAAGDLFGSLAGVALSVVHQGVAGLFGGAVVGPGVAHTFKYVTRLFLTRLMAQREQKRVGLVVGLTALAIQKRIDDGGTIRTDDFFDRDITDRSKADEIAEAVLISAQREHEERKLPYLANLLAYIAFESRIDVGMANYMIKTASSLTYRQYCVLSVAMSPANVGLQAGQPHNQENVASQVMTLLAEIFDLYEQRLLGFSRGPILDPYDMPLEQLRLTELAPYLHLAMKLDTIPSEDIASIVALLR